MNFIQTPKSEISQTPQIDAPQNPSAQRIWDKYKSLTAGQQRTQEPLARLESPQEPQRQKPANNIMHDMIQKRQAQQQSQPRMRTLVLSGDANKGHIGANSVQPQEAP